MKKIHPMSDRPVHIGRKECAKPSFCFPDPIPIRIPTNERFRRPAIGVDRQIVMARVVSKKRKNGVVALLPVRPIDLMVGPDLRAVIKPMPVSSQSINQKFRPVFTVEAVLSREYLDEKILKVNGAVGKVDRKRWKIAHGL